MLKKVLNYLKRRNTIITFSIAIFSYGISRLSLILSSSDITYAVPAFTTACIWLLSWKMILTHIENLRAITSRHIAWMTVQYLSSLFGLIAHDYMQYTLPLNLFVLAVGCILFHGESEKPMSYKELKNTLITVIIF